MNPLLLLAALRARYRVFLFVLAATVVVTLIVSLVMPKTYIATAAVLVDSKDEQSMNLMMPNASVRERLGYMQTQVDIISSQKVARKVVDALDLVHRPEVQEAFQNDTGGDGTIEDWLVVVLLKQLKIDTSQSSVLRIAFYADEANLAAQGANAFARAYMETALELRNEPSRQTAAWFDEQMRDLRDKLEQAQQRLTDYQRAKGIVDERLDVENMALTELASQMIRAQGRRAGVPADSLLPPGAQALRGEVARAEGKLAELSGRLGPSHPAYQRQQAEVRTLRARLAEEMGTTAGNSPEQASRRENDLKNALAAQQAKVLEMKQQRNHVAVLSRDVEIAQKAYETALQSAVNKRVESRASQTNITLLHAAAVPFKPARPRIWLNLLLAVVVGGMLGLCLIYLMEMTDHRVRDARDLAGDYVLPVLAELTPLSAAPHGGRRLLGGPGSLPALPGGPA